MLITKEEEYMNEPKKKEFLTKVIKEVKKGKSIKLISSEIGVSRQTIYIWLDEANINPKDFNEPVSPKLREKIDALIELNYGRNDIAKELNISRYKLDKYLKDNKLSTSGSSKKCKFIDDTETMKEIQSLLNCGTSQSEIAELYDVSTSRISQYIREKGLEKKERASANISTIRQISLLLASGYKVYEISNIMDISESTISKWINKYNLRK